MIEAIPQSFKTEQEVLATILISPETLPKLAAELTVDDFHNETHRSIWLTMLETQKRHETTDLLLISETAKATGLWEKMGGAGVLSQIMERVGISHHADRYVSILKDNTLQRRVLDASEDLRALALDADINRDNRLAQTDRICRGVFAGGAINGLTHARKGVEEHVDTVREAAESGGGIVGITSGISSLDRQMGGFRDGWQCLVMALPGVGKSAFAINNLALNCAKQGRAVAIFSLEMTRAQVMGRLIAAESGVPYHIQSRGQMDQNDTARYERGAAVVADLPIYVDEGEGLGVDALSARSRSLSYDVPDLGLIILDYIQLMDLESDRRKFNRTEEISQVTRTLKKLAKELGCVVVTLSQPTAEGARSERLTLAHAKGAQSIGADVDVAVIVNKNQAGDVLMDVAKFRHGPPFKVGRGEVKWNGAKMRFVDGDL